MPKKTEGSDDGRREDFPSIKDAYYFVLKKIT